MKKNLIPVLLCCLFFSIKAQTQQLCDFENIFKAKAGMDMPAAVAALQQNSRITLLSEQTNKIKPYAATGGDSIVHKTLIYRVDSAKCFKGKNNTIKFEFADGRLFKSYLVTTYEQNEYADMMANFDFLHKEILKSWPKEESITLQSEGMEGMGYTFTKTADKNAKTNMCMLQYIKTKSGNPPQDKYQLEVLWANLNNTRMENSQF